MQLEARDFERWLAERNFDSEALTPARLTDLFLACACLKAVSGAHQAFEDTYGVLLRRAAGRVKNGATPDEVLQHVRLRLFTKTDQRNAKLEEYSGSGDLGGWLRTVVLRVALSMAQPRTEEELGPAIITTLAASLPDPEAQFLKTEHSQLLKVAFAESLRALEPRQRTILKLAVVDGLSIDQIAPMYQVHRATVARWLATIRTALYELTVAELKRRLKVSGPEALGLLGQMNSQFNLSLDRMLKTRS